MKGTLYGIGTGPGDPELLTIKAVRILNQVDCIAVPSENADNCMSYRTALQAVPGIAKKEILTVPFPMTKDSARLQESHINNANTLSHTLDQGRDIAFLTIGDPSIYSTYGYIHNILREKNYPTEIVNGIPSFCAAASSLNEILCEGRQKIEIIPATYVNEYLKNNSEKPDSVSVIDSDCNEPVVHIYMKSSESYPLLLRALRARHADAFMAENCGLENEKIYKHIDDFPETAGYYTLIISKED